VHGTSAPVKGCPVGRMKKSLRREVMELRVDGRWFEISADPILDNEGGLSGIVHSVRDITERIVMNEQLRRSEEKYRALAESSPEMIYLIDQAGTVLYVNSAAAKMFHAPADRIVGKNLSDIYPAPVAARHLAAINGVIRTGKPLAVEMIETFPGGMCWIDARLAPVREESGAIIGVLGLSQDISERKKMETDLRNGEERLSSLFSNMAEGVALHEIILDENERPVNYRIVDCNRRYEEILGIKREDACGRLATEVYGTPEPPYLLEFCMPGITGEPSHLETYFPPMNKHFDISIAPWGKNGFATIFTDVTNQKKMEEELLRNQKMDALGVLAGGIAHDFNNLLAGMFGFMDLARESLKPGDPAVEYLCKAFLAFDRTKNLSRQLLTFSKGGMPMKHPIRLPELLHECCGFSLSGSNVRCVFSLPGGLAIVDADEHQVSQVFSNIMINARQAMPDGGCLFISGENRIISAEDGIPLPEGPYVSIAIKDEGIGIPENVIDRIFDPFFTTKQQGSGLGLAIYYSIIKKHGGHISVDSSPGFGTTFTVWLPASGEAAPPDGNDHDAASLKGTENILVMDDEPNIREMASSILSSSGYSVVTAADGREAAEKYRSAMTSGKPFDLVILDLTVPGGMGGEKAIEEIMKVDPDVIACVTSGYADNTILSDPASFGFTAMIAKPYRSVELLRTVKESLGKRRG
ncbi:MAG: PAS domain S-box protein, partial [Chitinispirillaceae bacterium]|nr:PAS domain S-box protein [Chitinispirillaceae bacterium]